MLEAADQSVKAQAGPESDRPLLGLKSPRESPQPRSYCEALTTPPATNLRRQRVRSEKFGKVPSAVVSKSSRLRFGAYSLSASGSLRISEAAN